MCVKTLNNILFEHENFDDIVNKAWDNVNERFYIKKVWLKLKNVKFALKSLHSKQK